VSIEEAFDDIILGGGKGGKSLAVALAQAGHKVALIERGQIGGTCINVACIPTKTMVASAKLFEMINHAQRFGIDASPPKESLRGVVERKRRLVAGLVQNHWTLFTTTPNLEFIVGSGQFVGPKRVRIDTQNDGSRVVTAPRIYINTGSRTAVPSIPGLDAVPYLTSTSIMELDELPRHLVIVGGGYIALEFAQIFRRLGSRVTVLLRGDRFLPAEDIDIADSVKQILIEDGIEFCANAKVKSVSQQAGSKDVVVTLDSSEPVTCSHLMLAIGRSPNTEGLNLDAAGVELDPRGHVRVNEKLETNVPGIWAIGDCNGGPLFTHVSWDDFRIIRDNVLHNTNRATTGRLVPYTLFIDPELGRVGLTEEQARKQGFDVMVARLPANKIPRANTSGEARGLLKAVVDRQTKRILGCSLLCHSAGEVMAVIQMAMIGQVPYTTVRDTIFAHPTMAESLNLMFSAM
jgi:probable pyridine nucleotide-disulfide oxidoreductase